MSPKILIATTSRWFPTARLGIALAGAGFTVEAVCPPAHPICLIRGLRRAHEYRGLNPVRSIRSAIQAAKPDLIVSGDDLATRHLHQLHRVECMRTHTGEQSGFIKDLIERSLGAPESFAVTCDRDAFIGLAKQEGIRVPETKPISDVAQLRTWASETGFPAVLKASRTSGGAGVRVVQSLDEAERGYRALQAPPLLARALKRAVVDGDRTLVWPSLLRQCHTVQVQAMISGREATTAVACWRGKVTASLNFEVLHKRDRFGPATVLQLTENPEMAAATARMVRRLGLSGLHGFDFMLEEDNENAYLIEINPRATQVGHLGLGEGRDLPAALYGSVSGQLVEPSPKITERSTIALFPHEWIRNPGSPFLQSAYHDVPWSEPALVQACVRGARGTRKQCPEQDWSNAFSVEGSSIGGTQTTSGK